MIVRYGDVVQIKNLDYGAEGWANYQMSEFIGQWAIIVDWDFEDVDDSPRFYVRGFEQNTNSRRSISDFWWAPHSFFVIGNVFENPSLYLSAALGGRATDHYQIFVLTRPHWNEFDFNAPYYLFGCPEEERCTVGFYRDDKMRVFDHSGEVVSVGYETARPLGLVDLDCPSISVDVNLQRIFRCTNCGRLYNGENQEDLDEEDRTLCPTCRKREFILPYHHMTPKLTFWKLPRERTSLYYGMEIEADKGGESNSTAKMVVKKMNEEPGKWFMYVTHDGSLDSGIEMVTAPCTLKYHLDHKDKYRELFRELVGMGYRAHNTTTCGLHIHFSRKYYEDNEEENISKLLYLVEKFWDEISILSRRNYKETSRYAKKCDIDANEFVDFWNKTGNHDGHYYAVNITNEDTIELRMFRGTLNVDTLLATLEFVDKLVRTAKNKTIEQLQSINFDTLLTPASRKLYQARCAILNFEDVTKEEKPAATNVRGRATYDPHLPF